MFSEEIIVPFILFAFVFGPLFYLIYTGSKLIRYRIDRKYAHQNSKEVKELKAFMERTELRLQALEEIVSEDGVILDRAVSQVEKKVSKERKIEADFSEDTPVNLSDKQHDTGRSKLRNQLKS
ncbi:hypothetical protein CYPRO_0327 [Cyclonatronum proteinivorum]|uniref:Uncharacterized protein n=1 Tax=Cyclonatronum proteinivorum TaxID=1457365 RepID=A0A345UGL3_9BACT|nr:hypothetical protein [Cyclonatronum proteinivorum]AXI99614.1 hypothetical protein CYPRO_0327 [Cyclonatronum proteinivorum]